MVGVLLGDAFTFSFAAAGNVRGVAGDAEGRKQEALMRANEDMINHVVHTLTPAYINHSATETGEAPYFDANLVFWIVSKGSLRRNHPVEFGSVFFWDPQK